jgi:hypothetical protein
MIYKIRIGQRDFERNAAGQFEIPAELADQADFQPNIKRVVPKLPVPAPPKL